MSGDLTENISRHELACKCGCGMDSMDWETIVVVQSCCDHFRRRLGVLRVTLDITSANRCGEDNRRVGGSKNSYHMKSRAMDISIRGVHAKDVYLYFTQRYPNLFGFGSYPTFTHIDTRANMWRG